MERQVSTWNECETARCTHKLERSDREVNQDAERLPASKVHSRSGAPRQRDKSGHGKNVSQQGALTAWTTQREKEVRTWKECSPVRCAHALESPGREASQDME